MGTRYLALTGADDGVFRSANRGIPVNSPIGDLQPGKRFPAFDQQIPPVLAELHHRRNEKFKLVT